MSAERLLVDMVMAAAVGAAAIPAHASSDHGMSWEEDLRAPGRGSVNVVTVASGLSLPDRTVRLGRDQAASGIFVGAEHHLGAPADHVDAEVAATRPAGAGLSVEVRGAGPAGRWTEWREVSAAGAALPAPVTTVQVRLDLSAGREGGPVVSKVSFRASFRGQQRAQPAALTYRVYATREGLVGHRTANGHVIVPRDHFVALPSRRALNVPAGSRDYLVKVCYPRTGRCATAPVWDVGPWNTRDDYWNPSSVRQMWADLPRGTPQAQAARLTGYNGGRDQFGRTVPNPAGIDLADGTFWDGLGMRDNDWVRVTYLWTG
jgi:hypothetical protein